MDSPPCKKPSPLRLRLTNATMAVLAAGKITVNGEENLHRLPQNSKVIFVTTHITDFDLPLAFHVLSKKFDIAITHVSAHKMPTQYPLAYLWEEIGGRKNFIPIDYKKVDGRWVPAPFNPNNFDMMRSYMERGKAIIISAHKPTSEPKMPEKPGIGAVYLAQITTGSVIVPVAVNIKSESKRAGMAGLKNITATILKRPAVTITICKPRRVKSVLASQKPFETQKMILVKQQGEIMYELAKGLPFEKAGVWATVGY